MVLRLRTAGRDIGEALPQLPDSEGGTGTDAGTAVSSQTADPALLHTIDAWQHQHRDEFERES